jgi:hypothetical protein
VPTTCGSGRSSSPRTVLRQPRYLVYATTQRKTSTTGVDRDSTAATSLYTILPARLVYTTRVTVQSTFYILLSIATLVPYRSVDSPRASYSLRWATASSKYAA